jgi:hypothetical protein
MLNQKPRILPSDEKRVLLTKQRKQISKLEAIVGRAKANTSTLPEQLRK